MRRLRLARGEVTSELTLHSRRRQHVPVRLISHAMPKAAEEEQLYQTAIIDLSDLKVAEERLRVTERLASLGTLSAGLAHEINNPLNSVLLSAQVALTMCGAAPTDPQIVAALEQIVAEARRGGRLVHNMLSFAKQEDTQKWPADLNDIVRRVVTLAEAAHENLCSLGLQLAPDLPQVAVNPTEIEQVLMNLIRNAREAANNGECRVLIKTEPRMEGVRLTVADNGPGIPPDELPRVFDPFFTTKRGAGGTGLGLSIVYAIVAGHSGSINVESRPGAGTRFMIDFPLHTDGEYHGKNTGR
jgi:two-component system, NtrC family, sensor kinase